MPVDRPFVSARGISVLHGWIIYLTSLICEREKRSSRTMSQQHPPPTFPTPNVTRSGYPPPPGSVYPPQSESPLYQLGVYAICHIEPRGFLAPNHGIYPPQQAATYSTSQPAQPPPAHRIRDPYSTNSHAPSSTYSYSSSPPHPSAHLPSSGPPQAHSPIPVPSVPGGYGTSTNSFGAPPPPMMQRVATMPIPGQGHDPHSVPYHNVPAPVIAHYPSHPHSGMSGGTRSVTGDWSHCACIVSNFYQNITIDCRREWNR